MRRRCLVRKTLVAAAALASLVFGAPAWAADPSIPVIVKDTTSNYWQIVLAGARKAGKDLHVNVPELGAQSESDINGQISILENAVSEKPPAIVIAPTQFKALGKSIDEATKKVKIIGIDSAADRRLSLPFYRPIMFRAVVSSLTRLPPPLRQNTASPSVRSH